MATQYDPAVLQKLAEKLYSRANTMVFVWTLGFLAAGAGGGHEAARTLGAGEDVVMFVLIGALIGGVAGFDIGQSRGFLLRAQAQIALCQKQIEENTRKTAPPAAD